MTQPIRVAWEEINLPKLGEMVILTTEKGVCGICLGRGGETAVRDFRKECGTPLQVARGGTRYTSVLSSLREYAMGWRTTFEVPLDFLFGTSFQRAVWDALREIPYGSCVSYQWVAEQIGKTGAARAVGNAIGKNPIPIIVPCHRVIRRDGSLGGFSAGVSFKKTLLEIEGCEIKREMRP